MEVNMRAGMLLRALSLPLLVFLLMSLSSVAGLVTSGYTVGSVHLEMSAGELKPILEANRLRSYTVEAIAPAGEQSASKGWCSEEASAIVFELPWYAFGEQKRFQSWLDRSQPLVCKGLSFKTNQPGRDASGLEQEMTALPWLVALLITAAISWKLYSANGPPSPKPPLWSNSILALACAMLFYLFNRLLVTATTSMGSEYSGLTLADPLSISILLSACLIIPFLEELAFRAWLIPHAAKAIGQPGAIVLSVAAFSISHGDPAWASVLSYAVGGTVFSLLWVRTQSLLACTLAHGSYNFLVLAAGAAW